MDKQERRAFDVDGLEVRGEGDSKTITGYAAVFDKLSLPMFGFREKIARGAFAKSVEKDDIRALWNHDANYVLGRNKKAKTLRLEEDEKGLRVEIDPPDTTWARDLMTSIQRKDVSQMSFGFTTQKDSWDEENKDKIVRTLEEVNLFDVSLVTFPAYPQTSVSLRSAEDVYNEYRVRKTLTNNLEGARPGETPGAAGAGGQEAREGAAGDGAAGQEAAVQGCERCRGMDVTPGGMQEDLPEGRPVECPAVEPVEESREALPGERGTVDEPCGSEGSQGEGQGEARSEGQDESRAGSNGEGQDEGQAGDGVTVETRQGGEGGPGEPGGGECSPREDESREVDYRWMCQTILKEREMNS